MRDACKLLAQAQTLLQSSGPSAADDHEEASNLIGHAMIAIKKEIQNDTEN